MDNDTDLEDEGSESLECDLPETVWELVKACVRDDQERAELAEKLLEVFEADDFYTPSESGQLREDAALALEYR